MNEIKITHNLRRMTQLYTASVTLGLAYYLALGEDPLTNVGDIVLGAYKFPSLEDYKKKTHNFPVFAEGPSCEFSKISLEQKIKKDLIYFEIKNSAPIKYNLSRKERRKNDTK